MAKQYVELYAGLCSFDNLVSAFQKAAKGKRANPEVAGFEFNLESNLWTLHRELIGLRYQPGAYRSFYIRDPKLRLISAAPFRDRVVHHALCNITEPLFDRSFIGDSYANRVGKGSHAALDRTQALARRYVRVAMRSNRRARCAARNRNQPEIRNNNRGFRVFVSLANSGS